MARAAVAGGELHLAGRAGAQRRRVAAGGVPSTSASDPLWDDLFPAEQARIVRALVERVVVGPAGADIRLWVAGFAGLVRDLCVASPEALEVAA